MYRIVQGENLLFLQEEQSDTYNLIYCDPPFNTGKFQTRNRFKTVNGERVSIESYGYNDDYGTTEQFMEFLKPRLLEAKRILKPNGSIMLQMGVKESHYVKILLDEVFGRENFQNQIAVCWDYGGKSKRKWSEKYDVLFWYTMSPDNYTFNYDAIDRVPYMAEKMVTPEKAANGKIPTSAWWIGIVGTNSKEKIRGGGYATQKPMNLMNRIIRVHSNEGDKCLDFFCGSGSFLEGCILNNRNVVAVDENPDSISIMKRRMEMLNEIYT